jgi:hypothetical protein
MEHKVKLSEEVSWEVKVVSAEPAKTSFLSEVWRYLKILGSLARKYLLAPLPAILLVIGAVILLVLGVKNIQIGGLLGKLFGTSGTDGKKAIDVANTVPPDRVREDGTLIKPGEPDSQGKTQAVVVAVQTGGLFSDPTSVTIKPPGEAKAIKVKLPDGVKSKDVDKVIVVSPEVHIVTVKDTSKVSAKKVDDLLKKYSG